MKKVYAVDDYHINTYVLSEYLQGEYEVVCFNNAKDCIDQLDKEMVDIVLMDCNMPIMSGYDATTIIKEKYPDIRVIGVTANSFKEDIDKCYQSGMEDVIVKPVFKDRLMVLLNKKN